MKQIEKTKVLLIALALFITYLICLPYIFSTTKALSFIYMIFPGVYLFSWLAFLMHECWHEYFPKPFNQYFYIIYSWMLFTDPQIFDIIHPTHHHNVNTYDDIEFHPLGKIENRLLRIFYNFLEILLGTAFTITIAGLRISRNPKFKLWKLIISIIISFVIWVSIGSLSNLLLASSISNIILSYLLSYWIASFFVHHNELVEHGNLIVTGNLEKRILTTRNLNPKGILEKIFLFLTHNDSLEHTIHHSNPHIYNRPVPTETIPMPQEAVYITFIEYLAILKDMLAGK